MPLDFGDFPRPFGSLIGPSVESRLVQHAIAADGDDMTWNEDTLSRDTALASESSLAKVWGDDYTYKPPLIPAQWVPVTEYRQLVRTVYRLQNEMAGLAAQVVELRERLDR